MKLWVSLITRTFYKSNLEEDLVLSYLVSEGFLPLGFDQNALNLRILTTLISSALLCSADLIWSGLV
jgi:hypothetical protein